MTDRIDQDRRAGLCGRCRHTERIVASRGTVYYLCRRSFTDPAFPKYPPLPLIACAGFDAAIVTPGDAPDAPRDRE